MSGYESEFRMFTAGEGESGRGVIILDKFCDRAQPCPEAAWPSLLNGNWRVRPLGEDGKPTPLFLLARAFVISIHAGDKQRFQLAPADSDAQACQQLRAAARADAWARDARLQAVTSCKLIMDDQASELIGDNEQFIVWFKSFRDSLKKEGKSEAVEAVRGYVEGLIRGLVPMLKRLEESEWERLVCGEYLDPVKSLPDVRYEILALCKVIGQIASNLGKPPSKAQVRRALKDHPLHSLREAAVRTNRFGELLVSAGFQWLPNGKAGRPPKSA